MNERVAQQGLGWQWLNGEEDEEDDQNLMVRRRLFGNVPGGFDATKMRNLSLMMMMMMMIMANFGVDMERWNGSIDSIVTRL